MNKYKFIRNIATFLFLIPFIVYFVSADIYDDTGLISYYNFNNAITDSFASYDLTRSSGSGYDSGIDGTAVDLASADYLTATIDYYSNVHSWSGWFQMDTTTLNQPFVNIGDGTTNNNRWHTFANGANKLQGVVAVGGSYSGAYEETSNSFSTGTWYHVACTQGSSYTTCWVNGVEINNPDSNGNDALTSAFDTICVGANCAGGQNYDGSIDELAIMQGQLNASGVALLYNGGSGYFYSASPSAPSETNLSLTAKNNYNQTIMAFNVTINGTTYETLTGIAETTISNNSVELFDISYDFIDYFDKTSYDVDVSTGSSEITGVIQTDVKFNVSIKINDTNIDSFTINDSTFYIDSVNNISQLFLLSNVTSVTFVNDLGYYNFTTSVSLQPLDNITINLEAYDQKITFEPFDYFTNATITNMTVNISSGSYVESHTTSGDSITFNLTKGHVYSYTLNATGYAVNYSVISNNDNGTYYQPVYLFKENSVYIRVFDEETGQLINYENVSVEFISDDFATANTTSTGALIVEPLISGDYRVRYSSPSYLERLYFTTLISGGTATIDVYLLNKTHSNNITAVVLDEKGDPVEDVYVKMLRYYLSCNCYKTVEVGQTNFNGEAPLRAQYNDEFYKFILEYNDAVYLQTNPFKITSETLTFYISLENLDPTSTLRSFQNLYYTLTFNNDTNSFKYTFSDPNNLMVQGCLNIYLQKVSSDTLINSTCVNSTGASILIGVDEINDTTYRAEATALFGDDNIIVDILTHSFRSTSDVFGVIGVFLSIFLLIIITFIGLWNKTVSIVLLLLGLVLIAGFGLVKIGITALMGIIGVGVIVLLQNKD